MRIYLDTCCLNRPFDDQTQPAIHEEAEAVLAILSRIETGQWQWVGSEILNVEVEQIPDPVRRSRVQALMMMIAYTVLLEQDEITRTEQLQQLGFHPEDAQHLACAEKAQVDVFLTTDRRLLNRALHLSHDLNVHVQNPKVWFDNVSAP
jgi:predicted nucleic acid-binding protein